MFWFINVPIMFWFIYDFNPLFCHQDGIGNPNSAMFWMSDFFLERWLLTECLLLKLHKLLILKAYTESLSIYRTQSTSCPISMISSIKPLRKDEVGRGRLYDILHHFGIYKRNYVFSNSNKYQISWRYHYKIMITLQIWALYLYLNRYK